MAGLSDRTEKLPARGREQRRQDVTDRLQEDHDAWVATASANGVPCPVPLSTVWDRDEIAEGAALPAASGT